MLKFLKNKMRDSLMLESSLPDQLSQFWTQVWPEAATFVLEVVIGCELFRAFVPNIVPNNVLRWLSRGASLWPLTSTSVDNSGGGAGVQPANRQQTVL